MRLPAFRPFIEHTGVNHDLTLGIEFQFGTIHGAGSGSFKVNTLTVISAAMTGAFEFIFTCFPIGRTAQVGAARINDEEPFCVADHPNAIIFLELCVYAETEIGWVANSENGLGFV